MASGCALRKAPMKFLVHPAINVMAMLAHTVFKVMLKTVLLLEPENAQRLENVFFVNGL
jgi:hypothetical protein